MLNEIGIVFHMVQVMIIVLSLKNEQMCLRDSLNFFENREKYKSFSVPKKGNYKNR